MPNRDEQFQEDLTSAIYDSIADTVRKYSDLITDGEALKTAVNDAISAWSEHYFESEDWDV